MYIYALWGAGQTVLHAFSRCVTMGAEFEKREVVMTMMTVDGRLYYKVSEAAGLAGVNVRTLRRWLAKGNLDHFLFPYRKTKSGPVYYRLEPPEDTDEKWEDDSAGAYKIPDGRGASHG